MHLGLRHSARRASCRSRSARSRGRPRRDGRPNMAQQILFVDDEERVLEGLRRMLRPMRDEWDMTFATSGAEALEVLARSHPDVIVSDMRMPGMDGAQLLT